MALWLGVESAPGNVQTFQSITAQLDSALQKAQSSGLQVFNDQGRAVRPSNFGGGWLIDGCPLNVYFSGQWQTGQQEALRAAGVLQCLPASVTPPSVAVTPTPVIAPPPSGTGATQFQPGYQSRGVRQPSSNGGTDTQVVIQAGAASAPSTTPGSVLPITSGVISTTSTSGKPVYRVFVKSHVPHTRLDSGASYPACSRTNPEGCRPIQFVDLDALTKYAKEHNEIPYQAESSFDAWEIMEGNQGINPSQVVSSSILGGLGGLIGIVILALGFLKGKKKS